jgi:hypothetical protein
LRRQTKPERMVTQYRPVIIVEILGIIQQFQGRNFWHYVQRTVSTPLANCISLFALIQRLIYSVKIPIHFPLYRQDSVNPRLRPQDKQDHPREQVLPSNSQNQKYARQTLTSNPNISVYNIIQETVEVEI